MSGCKSRCYPTHFNATLELCQVYSFSFLEVLFDHIVENILDIRMNQWYNARSRKSLFAKEITMIKMMFDEVKVGQKFVFYFDMFDQGMCYSWSYKKVGESEVKCISAPRTESSSVNKIDRVSDFVKNSECYIIED